ncbi:macrophage mannose receptor 1-like protein [Leptotrombidium deliense]|uniref:Macrophage mannose receptor 1-like protein n=1 Tax=Leptotrombidium deliense TaxID=299467 RepID=A0A443SCY4_9ACAR|nr:macrophage mannose receptor 1-like protein [Leptotrombidium deliense]
MVSIHTKEENEYLHSILRKSRWFWLGGVALATNVKGHAWLDGSPFNYSNWNSGQPDEHSHCVILAFYNGLWSDWYCHKGAAMLCQKPKTTATFGTETLVTSNEWQFTQSFTGQYVEILTRNQFSFANTISGMKIEWNSSSSSMTNKITSLSQNITAMKDMIFDFDNKLRSVHEDLTKLWYFARLNQENLIQNYSRHLQKSIEMNVISDERNDALLDTSFDKSGSPILFNSVVCLVMTLMITTVIASLLYTRRRMRELSREVAYLRYTRHVTESDIMELR